MTARSLLEALTISWPKQVRGGDEQMNLKTIPAELRSLAEKHREQDKFLEHLGDFLL